ncbi:hypothetical protein [Pseudoalteromonas sp.]|uniref:hypothetical protein n=1 Tax=Pseudoalteromonas sp. TaxID=53249 RepID=UPI002352E6CA|nr:hypothetical protein [Pseudoalteromonas sp.]
MKTRRTYASIAGLLQVSSTQLALKIAARDRFIIQSSGYLFLLGCKPLEYAEAVTERTRLQTSRRD